MYFQNRYDFRSVDVNCIFIPWVWTISNRLLFWVPDALGATKKIKNKHATSFSGLSKDPPFWHPLCGITQAILVLRFSKIGDFSIFSVYFQLKMSLQSMLGMPWGRPKKSRNNKQISFSGLSKDPPFWRRACGNN